MRAELPPAIAEACARAAGPALVFDRDAVARRMEAIAAAARACGIRVLFAAKSFPHPEVYAMAAERLDGFDAASAGELAALPAGGIVSIGDPTGCATAAAGWARLILDCDTPAHAAAAPRDADLAIRVSASIVGGDPAIGGVLEGSGRRRSRFGLDADAQLRDRVHAIIRAAGARRVGLHVHHGPIVATSASRFVETAHALLAAAAIAPAFMNLGGAWHGIPLAALPAAFATVRAAIPREIELLVEPGRAFVDGCGFATGRVLAARELADRTLAVLELSRSCHLRWSQPELVAAPPKNAARRAVLFAGPTCYEDDILGEWTLEPPAPGARTIFRNITGYAAAWNHAFAGIPAAAVQLV